MSNGWLTDTIINATQNLLQRKYFGIQGLQNTFLAKNISFDITKGEFVPVLHTGNNHWLALSTISYSSSLLVVYNSHPSKMPTQTKEQICVLFSPPYSSTQLVYANIQFQNNGYDCGLFALTFVSALCISETPENLFEQDGMCVTLKSI